MTGIVAFGAYIPRARLQRAAVVEANAWYNPALRSHAKGEKAISNWDEDVVTMAVEAARDCLADRDRSDIRDIFLASTTLPFSERQNSVIVKEALNIADEVGTLDVCGSQRAGIAALIQAMAAAPETGHNLCVASEKLNTRPGSEGELLRGDAAAAFLVGRHDVIARKVATFRISADFVDHFRESGSAFDYDWETRWVRDEGYAALAGAAIEGVLERGGCRPEEVDKFILAAPIRGVAASVAKQGGINAAAVVDDLGQSVGIAGTAHPLLMLAHCLQSAAPGARILVLGFGSGCDAILLERTDLEIAHPAPFGVGGWLARRRAEPNYLRYLSLAGHVEIDRGMRAEFDQKQPLTALWRHRKTVLGLVGGRCTRTGTVQFPRTDISVAPNGHFVGTQEDYPFAERTARILTFTSDRLTYTPDPPAYYGMIEFVEGGRMNAEFCDVEPEDVAVGREMRMMFRIKSIDEQRGFRRYFWKAAPTATTTKGSSDGQRN